MFPPKVPVLHSALRKLVNDPIGIKLAIRPARGRLVNYPIRIKLPIRPCSQSSLIQSSGTIWSFLKAVGTFSGDCAAPLPVLGKLIFLLLELIDKVLQAKGISRIYKRPEVGLTSPKMGKNLNP